ncbi:MAG: LPXTG cell wall anchor domain-containing protein [Candidatus Diapherotrites archaeon]|nr:LPXTG cell wall anchor domain-containing protein [Candidatus Diapherotrites archaeon]
MAGLEGEGTGIILLFVGALVILMIAIVIYFLIKKKQSEYTYLYKRE